MIHLVFDVLAAGTALAVTMAVHRWRLRERTQAIEHAGAGYAVALLVGAALGGYGLGTLNLQLSDHPGIGRSIIGALAGAILAIELFKRHRSIRGSTGLIFVPAFCVTAVIGRLGCYFAGLDDFTYGIPTELPWGHDFGDGIARHPVQLYEAGAMAVFFGITLLSLGARIPFFLRNGFYLLVAWYAAQRYAWEILKPYGDLVAGQNVFQLTAIGLVIYAILMVWGVERARPTEP